MFGRSEHNKILHDLNRYNMHNVISKKAQKILSFNPFMINPVPSRNVTDVPVRRISYFLLPARLSTAATSSVSFSVSAILPVLDESILVEVFSGAEIARFDKYSMLSLLKIFSAFA